MQINLLFTIDEKYISPLVSALDSFYKAHKGIKTKVFIAHSSIPSGEFDKLQERFSPFDAEIISVKITERWFSDTPVLERLPEESFYRLLSFDYLPKDIDKCLYLDPDIFINKPVTELYNMNLDGKYLAAASHTYGIKSTLNRIRLGIKHRYFNSGVMLMNLDEIRRDFTVQKVIDCLNDNMQKLIMGDQDLANILFGEKSVSLDEMIYNLDERTFKHNRKKYSLDWVKENTAVIHYNGKFKPWLDGYEGELDVLYPNVPSKGAAPKTDPKKRMKTIQTIIKLKPRQKIVIAGFLFVVILCIMSYLTVGKELIKIVSDPVIFRSWLDRFGSFDELVFIAIRSVQTIIKFIPAEPLEIGSGYAWGAVPGMLYCIFANMIGTVFIWVFTKKYGRKFVEFFIPIKHIEAFFKFKNSSHIYLLLFLFYLIPGSPKDGFTYIAGLLPIKFVPFMIVTNIARMPSVLSSTMCGATLANKNYLISGLILLLTAVLAVLGSVAYGFYIKRNKNKQTATDRKVLQKL